MALPPHPPDRLPAGLCVFGIPYLCGITWAGTEHANPRPLTAADVVCLAAEDGLSWAEMPARMLGGAEPEALRHLRDFAEVRGVRLVLAGGKLDAETLLRELPLAAELGSPVLRCTLSGVLCGDRRGFPGGWRSHLRRCAEALEQVVPEAERLGVAVAIENHQDADSDDLLALCRRFESRWLGVTLDTGNPLAVMEEPVEFAARIAPYLRHAHLKDYRVHHAPNGFRLVRCALGRGVIDFPALFRLFDAQEWPVTRTLEMGALQCRQIPVLEPSWWDEYAPRGPRESLATLAAVWNAMRPAGEEWRTPYEQGASGEALAAWEWEEHRASLEALRGLYEGRSACSS
jgi:3-oxoisoapionate decarboxylase